MQDDECVVLFLQFPGPSGGRYYTHRDLDAARRRLLAEGGTFHDGVYTRVFPDGRKINKDSHAACVEALSGKKLEFPEGRFPEPVFMYVDKFRWVPDRRLAGVERRHLGTFGERRTGMGFLRLAPGAVLPPHRQEDAELLYLVDGSVEYGGRTWHGGTTRDAGTYLYVPADADVPQVSSTSGGTFFTIRLPMLADLEAEARNGRSPSLAAE